MTDSILVLGDQATFFKVRYQLDVEGELYDWIQMISRIGVSEEEIIRAILREAKSNNQYPKLNETQE